eukprot:gene5914-6845_t
MGGSWGWNQDQSLESYQTSQELLQYFVETVSCGGNLLLNVGPTSNGKIPLIFQQRLADIGEWMGVNGEAIYAIRPWREQNDTASQDVWYTTNTTTNAVYAISFTWPSDGTLNLVTPVVSHETKVELLGYSEPLQFTATGSSGVNIKLPMLALEEYPPQKVYTFKLTNVK